MKLVTTLVLIAAWASASITSAAESSSHKKVVRDALAVDSSVAVKNDEARAIELPGVLKIDGANPRALDFTRAREIQVSNGGTQTVYISAEHPNRIQLPFVNPYLNSNDTIKIEKRSNSNNVYVEYIGAGTESAQIYIEPPEGGGYAVALELVPKNIPAQTILIKDDSYQSLSERKKKRPKNTGYIPTIQTIMEEVALGGTPNGFVKTAFDLPPIAMNGLMVEPTYRLSNNEYDVYYYAVTNVSKKTAELHEEEFDGDIVKAVSIFPKPSLSPGEKTAVIVIAGKYAEEAKRER